MKKTTENMGWTALKEMKREMAWISLYIVGAIGLWLMPESWRNEPVSREELAFFLLMGTWLAGFYVMGLHYRIRRLEKGDSTNNDL